MACTLEMTAFIRGEIQRRIKNGFSILLVAAYTIRLFGGDPKLSHIAEVPQAYHCMRLILNLSSQTDTNTPIINNSINREAAPELLKFGRDFPRILQAVWEADYV